MSSIPFNSIIKQLKERNIVNVFSQPKTQSSRFEILEFHGDSTLSYLISTYLLNYKSYYNPHLLTKLRSLSSSNQVLCDFFNLFELDDFLNEEELPRDQYLIKPRADIVECLISELSQSSDAEAASLLKGIVGFLISAGEKELNKEFPHIITQGLLKQPKQSSTHNNNNNNNHHQHHHHHNNSTPLNYKSTTNSHNNNCKKSSLSTVFCKNNNNNNNYFKTVNSGNNFKDVQPKATVSYVNSNNNKTSLLTPSSLTDSCKKTCSTSSITNSNNNNTTTTNFENKNFVKPIDISKSLSNNYKVVTTKTSAASVATNKNATNDIDNIIKNQSDQDIFITPNNVNSLCSSSANLEEVDFLLSPFSISLALNTNR